MNAGYSNLLALSKCVHGLLGIAGISKRPLIFALFFTPPLGSLFLSQKGLCKKTSFWAKKRVDFQTLSSGSETLNMTSEGSERCLKVT